MSKPQKAILNEKAQQATEKRKPEKATPKTESIPTPKPKAVKTEEQRTMARTSDFIDDARAANRAIWDGINKLKALQREWNALDYGNTLPDGIDQNAGITAAEVGAVVFGTGDALEDVLDAGHATNMAKLL